MRTLAISIAAMGGFLFGYNTAVIAGVMLYLKPLFALDATTQGWVVSILLLGALISAIGGGMVADGLGRKKAIFLSSLCFIVGCFLAAEANHVGVFIVGRLITGLGVGLVSVVCPLYLSEISEAKSRGSVVGTYQLAITSGILVAYIVNYFFSHEGSWRWMIALGAVPALLQLLFGSFFSESPRWLFGKGREIRAKLMAHRLHLREHLEEVVSEQKGRFSSLWSSPSLRLAVIVGLSLSIFQQITGINAIIYYAPQIFELVDFSLKETALMATVGIGIINVLATILSMWLLDRAGRKLLLLIGSLGMAVSLLCVAWAFFYRGETAVLFSFIGIVSYVGFFGISLGPVTWVVISEIYPLSIRGKAISLATFANWLFNYLVSLTFLGLVARISTGGVFILFAVLSLAAFFFVLKFLPETKGSKLSKIQKLFDKGK